MPACKGADIHRRDFTLNQKRVTGWLRRSMIVILVRDVLLGVVKVGSHRFCVALGTTSSNKQNRIQPLIQAWIQVLFQPVHRCSRS